MSVVQPKISVITPTRNRRELLPRLINCFKTQSWPNKELLILDDTYEETNLFTLPDDEEITFIKTQLTSSIGRKRNELIARSTGDFIAHFDDDDFYSPNYLTTMANTLISSKHDLIKLAGWFCLHENTDTLGFWDTTRKDLPHIMFSGKNTIAMISSKFTDKSYRSYLTGYGFSYFYRKSIWENQSFPDINLGEDTVFIENILNKGYQAMFMQDSSCICIHIIHKINTSACFPNYLIPTGLANKLLKEYKDMNTMLDS